ncbi:MAG: molybdate ABC transporter substrate-binding protein [Lutibacter sp.]|uniref:molybdate ABC transporter substrate-binding protein n=1 Tax=Lutibacter sp. TaxID=1925666 RepID=UPI00299EC089|nr:molybdate ABC transporter substrate-binding protein [Lutibacter sp.]MDX1830373.1 molybdate ABC transporter substrate-binding protein [Lutibacter sp.]
MTLPNNLKFSLKLIVLSLFILATSCKTKEQKIVTIATAANMQFAMDELVAKFYEETGIKCQTIISSSGKLTAQIKEGAPYDIFVSANMKYPNNLFQSGFTTSPPKIYAFGKLVLWTIKDTLQPSLTLLNKKYIEHIATANPKTAPYGIASIETLKNAHLYNEIESKLVYGQSIAQTNQFITSKVADIGFTSKSVVLSPKMKGNGKWIEIDSTLYSPIKQGVVIIKNKKYKLKRATKFYNFLFSSKAKEILNNFGYSTKK